MSELFNNEELLSLESDSLFAQKPVTVLGRTFANDAERREFFRGELRRLLPELRKVEGFPIGSDDDIINLSDPPYYTACPNPWLADFVNEWEEEKKTLEAEGKREALAEVKAPYASDVSEGKNNPIYNAHSYHTKVPHPAIMRYILHYTQPGDIVLDGFCGTGMTGVAAQMCEKPDADLKAKIEAEAEALGYKKPVWGSRHAVLGDLSPVASFIAYNYNTPVDARRFAAEAKKVLGQVEAECGWMYETRHTDGSKGKINYVVWSDVFICPDCGSEIVFWDAAVDKEKGELLDEFPCPACGAKHSKKVLKRAMETKFDYALNKSVTMAKQIPVMIYYSDKNNKRFLKTPDEEDVSLIEKIQKIEIKTWFPSERNIEGGETRRNDPVGITNAHQFFTKRNLIALSCLYSKLEKSSSSNKLKFIFTGLINRANKLDRFSVNNYFRGGGGWNKGTLSGTLYISSLPIETSVIEIFKTRLNAYDAIKDYLPNNYNNLVYIDSASHLEIQSESIDYIFTDPPFGANIMYSELNFIQESWLKVKTNNKEEAIENEVQQKGILEYTTLMQKCFAEYYRVLKPGRWITVEFSNTAASVWNAIQLSLNRAGFVIANVAALDKKLGSFKAVTTPTAVKQDLVISCYKPSATFLKTFTIQDSGVNAWSFVAEQISRLPIPLVKEQKTTAVVERSPKVLYDRLITYFLMRNLPVPLDAQDFQSGLFARYAFEDGMAFTQEQLVFYRKLKKKHNVTEQQELFVSVISNESEAIEWIKERLSEKPQKYQDIQPDYRKAFMTSRKGEVQLELAVILDENFIKEADGTYRVPDPNEARDREILRTKALLKTWASYCEQIESGKAKKLKDVRLEAVKAGFKDCYQKKDFARIVLLGDKIPENLLTEDEVLLNYYDIACSKV